MGPPFPQYPATPEGIREAAREITSSATGLATLATDVQQTHVPAQDAVQGDLAAPMVASPQSTLANARQVGGVAVFAGATVQLFANAVSEFNSGIDRLNLEWSLAGGADRAADSGVLGVVGVLADPLVEEAKEALARNLRSRYAALRTDLDAAARETADMLDRGPNEADWRRLGEAGALPVASPAFAGLELPSLDGFRQAIGDGVRDIGELIGDGIRDAGELVDSGLDSLGDAVDSGLDRIGDGIGEALEGLGDLTGIDGISEAGRAADQALDDAGDAVNRATDEAGEEVEDAADETADDVEDTADDIGDEADPDAETGEEDQHQDGEDGDADDQGEDDADDEEEFDRNGQWEEADGNHDDRPNPGQMYTTERSREHILDGDPDDEESGGHRYGTGRANKTEFPQDWDDDDVVDNVEDVAENPDQPPRQLPDGNWEVRGRRDGVNIRVIVRPNGEIDTAHPTSGDGVVRNDRNGKPHPKPTE